MAVPSRKQKGLGDYGVQKGLGDCFRLHRRHFNFPLPIAGWGKQSFCPLTALAEILRSQRVSLQGGRKEAFSPSALTPRPLRLASVHPASRGWSWESSGAAGLGGRAGVWTTPGMPGPGSGARLDCFSGRCGSHHTFLSPVQAGNAVALSICVWAHMWCDEHIGRSRRTRARGVLSPEILALRPSPSASALPGNLDGDQREGAFSPPDQAHHRPPWKGSVSSPWNGNRNKSQAQGLSALISFILLQSPG